VGVIGVASVNYVNDTTLAQIQNGAFIHVLGGSVNTACNAANSDGDSVNPPPQDGSVVVNAVDTAYVFSVDGGV
jgi:hypothetical protein